MEIDPDDATLYLNRSLCWLLMGDGGKALLDADECRNMRPGWSKACYRQGAALMLLKVDLRLCGLFLSPENSFLTIHLCFARIMRVQVNDSWMDSSWTLRMPRLRMHYGMQYASLDFGYTAF